MMLSSVVAVLPLAGAGLGLLLWSRPRALKGAGILVTAVTVMASVAGLGEEGGAANRVATFAALGAFATMLGQRPDRQGPVPLTLTLALLGLSLGALSGQGLPALLCLAGTLGVVGAMLLKAGRADDPAPWGAAATMGIGLVALVASVAVSEPTATALRAVTCATLLPLFPLHGAFVGAVSYLPGTLPAFVAIVLPCLGWYEMASLDAASFAGFVPTMALTGALYGTMRAVTESHAGRAVAYLTMSLLGVAWWHPAVKDGTMHAPQGYVSAVAVAMAGLLLAGYFIRVRCGHLDLNRLRGLARPMPRLGALVGLLITAAIGMPLFGVFSEFMEMMMTAASRGASGVGLVLLVWLSVSALLVRFMQGLLFGQPPIGRLLQEDVRPQEAATLILILSLLIVLNVTVGTADPVQGPAASGAVRSP